MLKVAGRCDLACDYCYMFAGTDDSASYRPRFMSDAVVRRVAQAIGVHAGRHALPEIAVILHGGEPLLAGAERLAWIAAIVREHVSPATRVRLSVQTNGVLLDEPTLRVLVGAELRVSVSLDGDSRGHDRHRRRANGSGSHDDVARAVGLLRTPQYRPWFAGLLCVVDLANDPVMTYQALAHWQPPIVDFLLPFGNWSTPPPGRPPDASTPYGDWLSQAFDAWYDQAGRPEVRIFREIITLLLGGRSRTEQIGLSPAAMVVFNTDGAIEQVDSLRSAYPGAMATTLTVFADNLDDVLRHPAVAARQAGLASLSDECLRCRLQSVCGGGHYVHRYRRGTSFRNPSVYCADLTRLILHTRDRIVRDLVKQGLVERDRGMPGTAA